VKPRCGPIFQYRQDAVAGCYIHPGSLQAQLQGPGAHRGQTGVLRGDLDSLRRHKDDIKGMV